jgi:hypothetical protein
MRLGAQDLTLHLGLATVAGIIGPLALVCVATRFNISGYLGFGRVPQHADDTAKSGFVHLGRC